VPLVSIVMVTGVISSLGALLIAIAEGSGWGWGAAQS
jgi:hypothetical protein